MPAFKIRRGCPSDASGVAEVWLRSRRAAVGYIPGTVHCDTEVKDWISRRILTQGDCWVAHTHNGEIIAMLVIQEDWIEQLYVSPDYQGIGIGSGNRRPRQVPGTRANNEAVLSTRVTRQLLDQVASRLPRAIPDQPHALRALSAREAEVFGMLAGGLTNAEIATALVISETTVKSHVSSVLGKLGLRDRVQAVIFAYETGLLRVPD